MKINRFEDIIAWQKAKDLTLLIYSDFKDNRDYSFCDQLKRASISISNNIAEGFERSGNKEFKYFLYIAKGSSAEVRSMLDIALDLKYINKEQHTKNYKLAEDIAKLLSGLIKTL